MKFDPVKHADWWHPQWLVRPPTPDEQEWILEWMRVHNAYEGEWKCQWKVIDDMLRAAGYEAHAGAGPEDDDLVRGLIHRAARADKIAEMHHKRVDEHGGTWGECNECRLQWPCPTYEWAKPDSARNAAIDCFDPADDDPVGGTATPADQPERHQNYRLEVEQAEAAVARVPGSTLYRRDPRRLPVAAVSAPADQGEKP